MTQIGQRESEKVGRGGGEGRGGELPTGKGVIDKVSIFRRASF